MIFVSSTAVFAGSSVRPVEDRAPAVTAGPASGLGAWFVPWHPRYRRLLVGLTALGAIAAALIYLENSTLAAFGTALRRGRDAAVIAWLPAAPPLVLLSAFGAARLLRLASEAIQRMTTSHLQNRARTDLERAILVHLLHKDDGFFASRPPAEILNRLGSDISRVNARRTASIQRRQSLLVIAGNLYFFATVDLWLSVIALGAVVAGALWMRAMTRPVAARDEQSMGRDERVKARFEDLLVATPEIQVSNLTRTAVYELAQAQLDRAQSVRQYSRVEAALNFVLGLSNVLALVALLVVSLYVLGGAGATAPVVLVPVILKALPEMFTNAAQIAVQGLSVQFAATSARRLLEYDSGVNDVTDTPMPRASGAVAALALGDVSYRYTSPDGRRVGGVTDVSVSFEPGSWTAIVGGSGAGKSTVTQLLLGRVRPDSGRVSIGDRALSTITADERASLLAFMPQTVMLLDTSIRENLLFGDLQPDRELDPSELAIVREVGLSEICRIKVPTRVHEVQAQVE